MQSFISASGQYLPGPPVSNDAMVDYIGRFASDESVRRGRLFLRQNGIRTRHYAIRPDGDTEWTLSRLAAAALDDLFEHSETDRRSVGFLASATTQNDLMVPGFASGLHAASNLPPMEIASLQSVCASAVMALKYAALQVSAGERRAGGGRRVFQPLLQARTLPRHDSGRQRRRPASRCGIPALDLE